MNNKLSPNDLINNNDFELIAELHHKDIKEFIIEQINNEKLYVIIYSVYQVLMIALFGYLFGKSVFFAIKGNIEILFYVIGAILFSLSFLIIIHELLHAFAYYIFGARKIHFGRIAGKFIFYAQADLYVIGKTAFYVVALMPLLTVKILTIIGAIMYMDSPLMYLFLSIMCIHSIFCSGDIAMLAFYKIHKNKEIYNYDNRSEGKTYFYARKKMNL